MSILSFGGCGDRRRLGIYAEVLTDEEAIQAFAELLAEAEIEDAVAYHPGTDTVVVLQEANANTLEVKVLAPLNGEVGLHVRMHSDEHSAEVHRNGELVAWC